MPDRCDEQPVNPSLRKQQREILGASWLGKATESRSSGLNWETMFHWMMWRVTEKDSRCQSQVFTSSHVHSHTWKHTPHVHKALSHEHKWQNSGVMSGFSRKALQFPEAQGEAYILCEELQHRHPHPTVLSLNSFTSPSPWQSNLYGLGLTKRISTHCGRGCCSTRCSPTLPIWIAQLLPIIFC